MDWVKRKAQCLKSALYSCWAQLPTCVSQMQGQVCCDRAVSDQVHLYLFRSVEEVVSDSRWGCSPIRTGLLEDDEWGWLREPWRNIRIGKLEMPTAVSMNRYKHAEGLLHTQNNASSICRLLCAFLSFSTSPLQPLTFTRSTVDWHGLELNLESHGA